MEFLLCLLGVLLIISAFVDVSFIIKEKIEKKPEINIRITKILEREYKKNNWEKNESTSDGC